MIAPAAQLPAQTDEPARAPKQAVRRTIRCAIYCRVSTDEQAALEYNSLQAQEEICRTYIAMRARDPGANERWIHGATYSDPGVSGGTLARPGLGHLLRDVEAGKLDAIVTYKLDRFSRSIGQFYQVWTILERHRVDLVSVTQDLNTGTAQGRLVLNVLLAFAQHERELTSERTRDKIAASRRRGRWTGGTPILGYDIRDGRLVVNEGEAFRVREIYRLYLEHPSLTRVVEELNRRGWTTKSWTRKGGGDRDSRAFDKPSLFRLLVNPLYAGKVRSNGSLHAGEHRAIVDEATWNRANAHLRHNGATGGKAVRNKHGALLRGLIHCAACGYAMTHSFTKKGNVLYRYYVCVNRLKKGAHACPDGKVSAHEAERRVVDRIRAIGKDPELIAEVVRQAKAQLEAKVKALESESKSLRKELQHAKASLTSLTGRGNGHAGGLADQIAGVEQRIRTAERRLGEVGREHAAAKGREIDEHDLAQALEAFGPVWDALWPTERTRILGLLVERIDHDGRDEGLAIRFRPDGIGALNDVQTT